MYANGDKYEGGFFEWQTARQVHKADAYGGVESGERVDIEAPRIDLVDFDF